MPETFDHVGIQRVLDAAARKGVILDVTVFDQSTHTAAEAAAALGADLGQIVKSLVFVAPGDGGGLDPILCLVAGHNRVDLARLAAVTGERDVRRATAREADELTGFSIGGIPPIGHVAAGSGDHGSGPRALPDRLGGGRARRRRFSRSHPATLRTLANAVVAPMTEERRRADVEAERDAGSSVGGIAGDGRARAQNAGV